MTKIDEIKKRRQQRFFDRRMAKASAKKKEATQNELMTHVDLISNPNVKSYIAKRKDAKLSAKREKQDRASGIWKKDKQMEESSDEEKIAAPVLAKIKAKTSAKKKTAKITKKVIAK